MLKTSVNFKYTCPLALILDQLVLNKEIMHGLINRNDQENS